ncbi:MAG: helix-turn-helix domain-containing protein, partial [Chloroflexi bacterium]|nr:helix-turn-helix domain-containing protein [Chloroflexota bacterium]
ATLYRWIAKHHIIPLKLHGRTYISRSEIERLTKGR